MLGFKAVNLKRAKVEGLVVPVCEDRNIHTDPSVTALIDMAKAYEEFKGEKGRDLDPVPTGRAPRSPGRISSGLEKRKR